MLMTTGEMLDYTNRFKSIVNSNASSDIKDVRLANLMNDLESAYQIPMIRTDKFEIENFQLMQLYRTVSSERNF